MLLFFGLTTTSLLNGQAVLIGTPTGGDANDPSLAVNNPTGVACAGGGTETWLDFDGVAGNNASQEGGMAIGARHNEDVLYTFPSQPAGDYLLFYEHANPGLLECDGTMLNGNGRWRFNIGNGNVNGPIIASGISTTMEWFKASVSMTATAAFTTLNMEARRQGALGNPYMQIDNVVLIAVPAGAGPCYMSDLGSPALNACYGTDVCFPQSNSCAEITPGDPHMNPAGCPVTAGDPDALVIIPIPDFDPDMDCAAAEAMTFDMVVPDLKVHYTYWGNCSPRSPEMPTVLDAQNQGFITQFFCDLDTDGLPAFPSGLSGESGIVDFIPANTEDAGCNGFVDEATSDCICGAGSNGTDPEDAGVELLQLDFWVAIPTYQTQVGFNFDNHTGNPVEGASFFAGPNTASMCEVNYYNFGGAGGDHNDEPQQPSGTYTLDHGSLLQDDCNASWLRVRVYMSDVKDRWGIIPQMDCGNGYGPISALPVAPAMSAGDNSQPAALTTMSVEGYSLLDTESGITFFYDALGNPKKYACNPVALVGDTGVCAGPCPVPNPIDVTDDEVCDGMLGTTISDWMDDVEADADNMAAIADAITGDAIIYSLDTAPTEAAPPTAGEADASHTGTGCANETETTYAYLLCLGADAAVGGGDDTYLLLGTHTLTVYPPAQDPMDVIDACTNTPTAICPNDAFDAVATNATGGADVANWNGTTYTAQPGDLAGTIDLTVTTTNGCTGTFPIATPACPAMCPAVNPIDEMDAVCDGMLGTTISDWMMSVEDDAANTAAIMDANTAAALIYSMDATPTETAPPTAGTADASHAGTGCANETETTYAYLLCLGADAAVGGGDDTYLLLGTHTLTVYPPAQDPMDVIDACTNTPTAICAGDSFGAASNPTGGASIANWNASTGVYTAQTGDAAGTIDIAITTTNNCTESFEITTPDCGGMCPVVNPIFGTAAVCDGMLGTTISDWETSVEMNPANAAAIADANTAAAIIYSVDVAPTEATPPSAVTADASHSGTGCANETESTYAYLLCMGIDGAVGGGDDIYMLLGIHTLTVYPPAQDPTDNITGCTNTPTLICDDTFGAASNPSGGASTANWDSVTGVYTAQSGDAAGTIDIEITTSNGCTGIFEIATPACGSCDDAGLTGADICASITALGAASPFHGIDCDDDGENNEDECDNGTDPLDPCDNSYADGDAVCAAIDAGATGFANVDCDGGGVSDEDECDDGTDPTDPCDDTGLTGTIICASLDALGTASPFHGIDCDGDGETNEVECDNGTDPLDPCDNNYDTGDEICAAILAGATGFADVDCDGGGVNDEQECANGTDPTDPCDDNPPAAPATECWETATYNNTTCIWEITGTQPAEPTNIECWETATFNNTTCTWNVTGTQPTEPTTECYQTATFNNTTCVWVVSGTQAAEPATECWETATFNNTNCTWNVTGTQPAEPTIECFEVAIFNNTTCLWEVSGSATEEPNIQCWETATFNATICSWVITGTQPREPDTECWETATFNNAICAWEVTGTLPADPGCDDGDCTNGMETWDGCDCIEGTPPVIGCTNPLADNYNPAATCDDASCEFGAVDDCPDPGNCDDNICENGIEMWDFDLCECVSGIAPDNCDDLEIISFDFDDCHAMTTDMSHTDYSEFQPEYPNTLDCGTIVASILHRDEPDTNSHSCTPGLDNSSSMCVSSLESCDADFTSNKAVKFSITVSPLAGDTITISSLQFMQNAPVNFDWINGSSGLNNYPTLYGIQVLQNGTIIYSQEDLSTSTAWTQEVHNFTGVSSIEISQQTTLDILLLSYCPVGVQSNVTAWDLENLKVFGSCNESLVGSRMISGKITSLNNEQFDDVLMTIEGGDNLVSAMADSNGEYSFADNSIGETYVVSAFKDSDYLKGISTLDLLIIQRHILGISTFNDPLLYHAADINNDSNISAIDLIDLRKLILGIIDEFPENLSYRFFDESKVRNDSNPWLLPEEIMVINLETDEYALDFNPIKVGDVTSLIAKKKTFNNRSNDSDNHIELYSSKTDSRYSDIVTTNFYITEQLSINGFQLAIDLKESEFGKLIASNQMLNDIDYHVSDDNILRILWTGEIHFASGENLLFSIQTTASHHDHKLSSVISPEIYVDTDAIKMQLIKNNSSLANSSITNLRVYPNPFSDKTEVEFDLINDSKVDIHLYDTAGKLLYRENRPFVKGKNRIPLNEELFTSGIYFIKVSTDKESLTDRLVKLK